MALTLSVTWFRRGGAATAAAPTEPTKDEAAPADPPAVASAEESAPVSAMGDALDDEEGKGRPKRSAPAVETAPKTEAPRKSARR